MMIKIECSHFTHKGQRSRNEDFLCHLINNTWGLFIVADGLGGHQMGDWASETFSKWLIHYGELHLNNFLRPPHVNIQKVILNAYQHFIQDIQIKFSNKDPRTTFALVWIFSSGWVSAHVGDSRIYWIRQGKRIWQSRDHSLVQQLIEQGKVPVEQRKDHPGKAVLTRSIGRFEPPRPYIHVFPSLTPDDTLLVCSDGFWENLKDEHISMMGYTQDLTQLMNTITFPWCNPPHPFQDNLSAQLIRIR